MNPHFCCFNPGLFFVRCPVRCPRLLANSVNHGKICDWMPLVFPSSLHCGPGCVCHGCHDTGEIGSIHCDNHDIPIIPSHYPKTRTTRYAWKNTNNQRIYPAVHPYPSTFLLSHMIQMCIHSTTTKVLNHHLTSIKCPLLRFAEDAFYFPNGKVTIWGVFFGDIFHFLGVP